MTTVNQGISVEEIERVVAQRVANAIEAITKYETKTNLARKSRSQTERQEEKVAENARNKRKWGSNQNGRLSQQNKGHKVPRAHTAWPINKKAYAGSLPLCNQYKSYHNGPRTVKCGNCKKVGHVTPPDGAWTEYVSGGDVVSAFWICLENIAIRDMGIEWRLWVVDKIKR
nr:reverse transcriptase domain-containing protein [Tanacetum cinerariifolium]